jgi:hypothetical protein
MQALLVGGPRHGDVMLLDGGDKHVIVHKDEAGAQFLYVKRSSHSQLGTEVDLFVHARPTYDEVLDAIAKSSLSETAKLRVLGI